MKKVQIMLIALGMIMITGCSSVTISPTNTTGTVQTGTENTGEIQTIVSSGATGAATIETGIQNTEIVPTTNVTENTWKAETKVIATGTTNDTTALQDEQLKKEINTLVEKNKIENKWATGLTEKDIDLMQSILKQIVDKTSQK